MPDVGHDDERNIKKSEYCSSRRDGNEAEQASGSFALSPPPVARRPPLVVDRRTEQSATCGGGGGGGGCWLALANGGGGDEQRARRQIRWRVFLLSAACEHAGERASERLRVFDVSGARARVFC